MIQQLSNIPWPICTKCIVHVQCVSNKMVQTGNIFFYTMKFSHNPAVFCIVLKQEKHTFWSNFFFISFDGEDLFCNYEKSILRLHVSMAQRRLWTCCTLPVNHATPQKVWKWCYCSTRLKNELNFYFLITPVHNRIKTWKKCSIRNHWDNIIIQ